MSRRRTTTIGLVLTGIILLTAAGGLLFQSWANQPATQSIKLASAAPIAPPTPQTIKTDYFTFQAPAGFKVRTAADPANPLLLHSQVFESRSGGRQLGITSTLLPSDGLTGVADYHLRAVMTSQYQKLVQAGMPAGSQAFKSTSGTAELTIFLVNGNRYASLTATGSLTVAELQSLFSQAYTTWRWQ